MKTNVPSNPLTKIMAACVCDLGIAEGGAAQAQGPAPDGLVGWYQASSLGLSSGAPVSTWSDLSGNGNTLSANGSGMTYQTNVLNGQPAVQFTGNGYFSNASMNGLNGASFEMFAVLTNVISGSVADIGSSGSIYNNEAILGYSNGVLVFHESSSANYASIGHQTSPGTSPYILEGVFGNSPSDLMSYVNGVGSTDAVTNAGSPQSYTSDTRQLIVGTRDVNFSGDIAELLIYDNTLTVAQQQRTGYYLQTEYNIAGTYSVPEPSTWGMLAAGAALLLAFRRRLRKAKA